MSIFFVLFCHLYSSWSCAGLSSKSLLVSDRFFPPPSMVTSRPFQEETSLFLAFCNCSDIVCFFAYFVAQVGLFPFAISVASGLLISKRNRLKRRNIERMAFFFDDQLHEIDLVSWLVDVRTPFPIFDSSSSPVLLCYTLRRDCSATIVLHFARPSMSMSPSTTKVSYSPVSQRVDALCVCHPSSFILAVKM